MKPEEIKLGMVFTFGIRTDLEYVVISLHREKVMLEQITNRSEATNRHMSGYGHFEHALAKYIRTMDEKELSCYLSQDLVCDLEKGIYRVKKDIDTLLEQPAIKEGEVIRILAVCWDDYQGCKGEQYKLHVIYQQFGKGKNYRLAFHATEKMGCIRWFQDNFHKINIHQ
jgi:uncharacterized protein YbaR (Trm112 family)